MRIFFSYARGDDEPFVRRLYEDLKDDFDVWFDHVSMPSRRLTFHQEIRDAVAACDRLVLVVGPRAVTSDYVYQEWRFAYVEADKCINPIVRLDGTTSAGEKEDGFGLIPKDLKLLHAEDFRDDANYDQNLANLKRQLSEEPPRVGKLVAVPQLPPHFREIRERTEALRDILLVDLQSPVVVSGAALRIGVQGMGGIGKSVLANALARRPDVRRAFPDGVFWIAIGQDPNLAALQSWLAYEFGDEALFDNTKQGKETLRRLLKERAALLVLDDVWQRDHAEAFNIVGPRGRVLLTTRDAGLVTALAARENHYEVQLPTMAEAEVLLAAAAELEPTDLGPEAREVIARCGFLPLALALCGGMVAGGTRWSDLLEALSERDLEYLSTDHPPEEQHQSVWRAMDASIRTLAEEQRDRFAELAVFPIDTGAPEIAIENLWVQTASLSRRHARELLVDFSRRSLIQKTGGVTEDPQSGDRITLHDLLHHFATGMAEKRFGSLTALHARLLEAYNPDNAPWHTIQDDGYLYGHLDHHLGGAAREDEWRSLLTSFAWLKRKTTARGFLPVLLDLAVFEEDGEIGPLHRLCRRTAHVLTNDPTQLAAQFIARLDAKTSPRALASLIEEARTWHDGPWLRPLTVSLGEEGEPTLAVFRGREQDGHAGTPRSIALSVDRELVASGGGSHNDLTVKVWAAAGKLVQTYSGAVDAGGRTALAFIAADGRLAAARGNEILVYSVDADEPVVRRTFQDGSITCICGGGRAGVVYVGFSNGGLRVGLDGGRDHAAARTGW